MEMKLFVLFTFMYSVYGYNDQEYIINTKYNVDNKTSNDNKHKDKHIEQVRRYKPDWKDLDTRPLPEWYDRAKIGIFLHWGVYSVPGFFNEWFWKRLAEGNSNVNKFMRENYSPGFTYQQFVHSFTAKFFKPDQWADLFKKAGAKYVVLTSKHHDGFTLFPSKHASGWNAADVGPRRNLVKALSKAVRKEKIEFGIYYSLYEWFNPMYLKDKATNFSTHRFVYNNVRPDIEQLVNHYKPSVIWSDGHWEAPDKYWKSTEILAWLYNDSPVKDKIVVNDRWGESTPGKHGDFYNYDDEFFPEVLQKHKWESAFKVDKKSWGYRRNIKINDLRTLKQVIDIVVKAVSCGGNALINVGPTKEGIIEPVFQERLLGLGEWLAINGEAIYESSPWWIQNDSINSGVWYTCKKNKYNAMNPTATPQKTNDVTAIYAIILRWPLINNVLKIKSITSCLQNGYYNVKMLGQGSQSLRWIIENGETHIVLPNKATVRSKRAWTLKFTKNKRVR